MSVSEAMRHEHISIFHGQAVMTDRHDGEAPLERRNDAGVDDDD